MPRWSRPSPPRPRARDSSSSAPAISVWTRVTRRPAVPYSTGRWGCGTRGARSKEPRASRPRWLDRRRLAEEGQGVEVLHGEHDPLEMAPPDHGSELVGLLPDRRGELPEHGQPVVSPERVEVIAPHAARDEGGMISREARPLQPTPALRIPMHRHHVGEIVGADVDAPAIPVEESDLVAVRVSRVKGVPGVGVAVDDREVAVRSIAGQ